MNTPEHTKPEVVKNETSTPKTESLRLRSLEQEEARQKAETLIESLDWLKRFRDQIIVIKFGGNAMVDEDLLQHFADDMVYLRYAGILPVVVHGGGPQITQALEEKHITSEFRGGYRYTSTEAIQVVTEVLTTKVRAELTDAIDAHGQLAAGTSGAESDIFIAEPLVVEQDGERVELGHVGQITQVNTKGLIEMLHQGRIPVVSSIAREASGGLLNINADAAAAELAIALSAAKLMILTDVAGLYQDWPNMDSLISVIDTDDLAKLMPKLESGMIPKMQACLDAVQGGVDKAAILDGRQPHAVLLEIFTTAGIGTEVVPVEFTRYGDVGTDSEGLSTQTPGDDDNNQDIAKG